MKNMFNLMDSNLLSNNFDSIFNVFTLKIELKTNIN